MVGRTKKSHRVVLGLLVIIIGIASVISLVNYAPPGTFEFQQPLQTNQQTESQAQQTLSSTGAASADQPKLTPTGEELIFKELDSNQPYTIEYEFKYPSRIGYEFSFTKNVDFYASKPYSRQAVADRDVSSKIGKFDVNDGEQGTWILNFVPKEGELKGTFKIIEILKFE